MEKILELGKVVNTHGIRGEVKIQPWCDDPMIFDELEYVYVGGKRYDILKSRLHKNCVIAALSGIPDINAAELLRNQIVTVEREMLGELPEGTYYIADLEGLSVKTVDGELLGTINEVIKTGSNDVYVLDCPGRKPILIPVIDQVVREVNIEEGYVLVELMKGLID
ncbi:MAG: 16S rRNA processing protein RimM [Clostridia bacterium]|nr:16S rRNA processing protein RimM [Clostridia bacterium]